MIIMKSIFIAALEQPEASDSKPGALFPDLSADSDDTGLSEIESLCFGCYKQVTVTGDFCMTEPLLFLVQQY
jgi:hypothetical protein